MTKLYTIILCLLININLIKPIECPCADLLETLVATDIIPVFAENLYVHTYALTNRPIFTLPALSNNLNTNQNCSGLTFNIFCNYTPGIYTNKIDNYLNDYIQFAGSNLFQKIESNPLIAQSELPFSILEQFRNFTINQYRIGTLITANYIFNNNFRFEIGIPLVYQLRHYNLPEESIIEIKRYNLFDQSPNTNSSNIYKYVVGDTIGFEDGFIRAGWVKNTKCAEVESGFLFVIPTGASFKTGIIGQDFRQYDVDPDVNYAELLAMIGADKVPQFVREKAQEVGIATAYRLSAMVLNQPLGQESKGGIGLYQKGSYHLEEHCYLEWLVQGAYQFERSALRYYITQKDKKLYNNTIYEKLLEEWADDPTPELCDKICDAVNFINKSITNTLLPQPQKTCLYSEGWYQAQFVAHADYQCWHAILGLDWWFRAKPYVELCDNQIQRYNKCASYVYFNQYQLKLVGGIGGYFDECWGEVSAWLKFDQTMIRQGIGADRTINLQIDIGF
jgi:hypothetical protein